MSDTTTSEKVSGELLPCPLCGGDAKETSLLHYYQCGNSDCLLGDARLYREAWQALPRVSGELAEVVQMLRATQYDGNQRLGPSVRRRLSKLADRIATHAEKPGACSHWIGGEVRGRCGRDAHAETAGERGPGVLGPFGGHGEPPAETPGEGELCEMCDLGPCTCVCSMLLESVAALKAELQSQPPSTVAAVVAEMERLATRLQEPKWTYADVTHGQLGRWISQLRAAAPEPVRGQEEAWVEFEDPDEIGVELLITDVHLAESDLHTERWVRVPVHGAPQTEPGPATPESPEALYYCASRVVDALDADLDALDVAHHELRMVVKRIRRAQPAPVQVSSNTVGAVEGHLYVHGAPQTEQGVTQAETDCATCESTMDELRDKLAGAYDSLREHMDMVKAERDRIAELEETETTLRKRNGRLGEHNRRWMDRDADNLDRIAELELALDNACRIMEEEMDDRLVPWKEFVTGLQPAPDSPAETDEGPCGGCNILPQDRAMCRRLARNGNWGGCPPYLRWLRKHGTTVLPPHPKPNKA